MIEDAILIAGPTASGKSQAALRIARETGGTIVNADSMQVYSILNILTARPRPDDLATAPHRLYGHIHPAEPYSTGRWLREIDDLAKAGAFDSSRPIFVGGTGLYFKALLDGLSPMPRIPDEIRAKWRQRLEEDGPETLHHLLAEKDRDAASAIRAGDGQRLVRALEVLESSGRSILAWRAERGRPLVDRERARLFAIEPDRRLLASRIDARFDRMMAEGAIEEVQAMIASGIDARMPAMKAIGVRELTAAIEGRTSLEQSIEMAKSATRRYAKRQATWFRYQLGPDWRRIEGAESGLPAGL